MAYIIKDENNQTMRVVGRQEEARQICNSRPGWTFKRVVQRIIKRDGYSESLWLGEAPF